MNARQPIVIKPSKPLKAFLDLEVMCKGGIPLGSLFTFAAHSRLDDSPRTAIANELVRAAIERGDKVLYLNMEADIECSTLQSLGIRMKPKSNSLWEKPTSLLSTKNT